jgi:uncharacterized circularly permuted ATP-grasp superfamily protein/uncharacterized alpha-E superfamily protein
MAESLRNLASQPSSQAGSRTAVWNEMTDAAGRTRSHWQVLGDRLASLGTDERVSLALSAERMIEELGTTFNVFSDVGGAGRPYELDAVPLVIPPAEWSRISAGLAQRHRLLDAVLADLYGPQTLLQKGLIPPDLVHSNASFLSYACGVQPHGGRFLFSSGCDLVRESNGSWMVLRDHTGTPGGLGQAFENRNVISKLLADPFDAMRVARLSGFAELERATFRSLGIARRDEANIVFLTPGFRHPSYFEHAYKARLLGLPLVQPVDLTVRERRLYLKTLAGLRRIDGVVCRINHDAIDPLEHWGRGGDGIPGIIEAWRAGNVALANPPGAGFASSLALMPFLPGVCREWYGEEMMLPFVETWWLGQEDARRRVMDQLHRFVLLSASPDVEPLLPIQCSTLSPSARRQWLASIEARPHDFVAQADVRPSEAPSLEGRSIRQRPVVWRAFTLFAGNGPVAFPGGLARVGKSARPPQMWPWHAGFSKDVWVTGVPDQLPGPDLKMVQTHARHSAPEAVPSSIAEQLFWVGRYAERIELATRLLRVTLRCLSGDGGRMRQEQLEPCLALINGCGILAERVETNPSGILKTLAGLIHDSSAGGSIPALVRSLLINAAAARDRLSDDTWRFFNRLEGIANPPAIAPSAADLLRTLDSMVLHLAAFAGMQAENMTRGHGWRFLEVGRRIERAIGVLNLLKTASAKETSGTPLLEPLLETCDSVMTYRRRHFSSPEAASVIHLVFSDLGNPRSAAYQIHVIRREIPHFPGQQDGLMPGIHQHVKELEDALQQSGVGEFENLCEALEVLSDMLTQHFFSHSVRKIY